jgi:putative CocE/NonD family hydrolase
MNRTQLLAAMTLLACLGALAAVPAGAQGPEKGAGTEHRRWVEAGAEAPISPAQYDVVVTKNATMQVRDGTTLKLNLYLPDAEGPFPCLLIQEGYGKDGFISSGAISRDFASRGYAVVQADIRGMGASEGEWEPFVQRQHEDGYDLVEWTADQPFCTGKVGTFGTSYMAIDQFLTAKELPPSLGAMIPVQGWGDAYLGWAYKGGMRSVEDPIVYLMLEQALLANPPSDNDLGAYTDHLLNVPAPRVLQSWRDHPNYDAFWEERSTTAEDHARMAQHGIAILFQGAWNDFFLYPELKAYTEFADAAKTRKQHALRKMVIGPWTHGREDGVLPYSFQEYRVLWFDHWLKGIDNGVTDEPKVLLYVQGAEQWRFEDDWPIPDAKNTRFYLRAAKSGSAVSLNDGTLTLAKPAAGESSVSYVYTPAQVAGGGGLIGAQSPQDQRLDESRSLTWTSPPLPAATEVTGPITFRFWASSSAADTDFVARIVDVAPDGTATQMTRGWLKATHHSSHSHPTPLTPGEIYEFEIEVWPNSNVYGTGHRIRLDLSGADLPLMEANPNAATVTVYQDAENPSYVELPIIGRRPALD